MKFPFIFFLIIFTFFNFSFAEERKTSSQELQELGVTELQLCNVVCDSEFSNCYKDNKKNAISCAAKVLSCKANCKKTYRK